MPSLIRPLALALLCAAPVAAQTSEVPSPRPVSERAAEQATDLPVGVAQRATTDLLAREIPYQGTLTDGGAPVTAATPTVFRLHDAATGGSVVWSENQTVTPDADGRFTARLGSVSDLPTLSEPLWLSVTADGTALGPRTPLGAAPYALSVYGIRVEEASSASDAPAIAAGHPSNEAGRAAVVAGGGFDNGSFVAPNRATGAFSAIGGGYNNTASGTETTIAGGNGNTASGTETTIGGGNGNTASVVWATVGGGQSNTASDVGATVGGGRSNMASGGQSTIGGGFENAASGTISTIGGGFENAASGTVSAIGGGQLNSASGSASTVGGGLENTADGVYASIPGGRSNFATGATSLAAGDFARAIHDGAFVWSDAWSTIPFSSTGINQFLIDADGGVGIGTNAPLAKVHIQGERNYVLESALENEEVIVEAGDAVIGLYSTGGGTWGSALSLGEVTTTGDIASKWGIARRTGASGGLYFTFGTSKNYATNDAQMRIDTNGDVRADGSFIGGGADLAEFFPLADGAQASPGQVVGLTGGRVSLRTDGAEQVAVISSDPAFIGNPDAADGGALVALVGQVEVSVAGAAAAGDLLIASGAADGRARAISPSAYTPADGAVIGRVLTADGGRVIALVGVDEAAALRGVVEVLLADRDRQQAELDALRAEVQAIREALAPRAAR